MPSNVISIPPAPTRTVLDVIVQLREEAREHRRAAKRLGGVIRMILAAAPGTLPTQSQKARITPLSMVYQAVSSFGSADFSLHELSAKVDSLFPLALLDRAVISRRLYDLRKGASACVISIEANAGQTAGIPKGKKRYKFQAPPGTITTL